MPLGDIIYRASSNWKRLVGNTVAARKFLRQTGDGTNSAAPVWDSPEDSDIQFTDNTTNDVSITKHGYTPKAPNDATKFLNGTGAYSVPAGTGINQLTGDVTAGPGSGSQAATLSNTGVSANTYGDANNIPQITVDAKGRITAATTLPFGNVRVATATINDTQIKALNSSPVEVIAAPGSGKIVLPFLIIIWKSYTGGSSTPYGTSQTFTLRYAGLSTDITNGVGVNDTTSPSTGASYDTAVATRGESGFGTSSGGISNRAVNFRANADTTGTSGSTVNFLKVWILYTLFDTN